MVLAYKYIESWISMYFLALGSGPRKLNFSLVGGCSLICVFQIHGFGLREYIEFPHTWLADDCIEFTTAQNIHS